MADLARLAVSAALVGCFSVAQAADWSTCANELDRIRRSARDASDIANDVNSKAEEFQNCRRYPDMYDFMRDKCQSKGWDYQNALSSLKSELDTLDRRIRSASSSCGYSLSSIEQGVAGPARAAPGNRNEGLCEVYRPYRDKLPLANLLELCRKQMSDAECRKCLAK
jgi:hypothetical protein